MASEHRRTWQQKENLQKENLQKEVNLVSLNLSQNQNQKGRKNPLVDMQLAFLEEMKQWKTFSEKEKSHQVK